MVFDAKTFQKICTYSDLKENKPVNVILPVKNQVIIQNCYNIDKRHAFSNMLGLVWDQGWKNIDI